MGLSEDFDLLFKAIDKSNNRLVTITDKNGNSRKVWKHVDSGDEKDAGKNAGKAYERTGKRHTTHSGFESGDTVSFIANGKEIKGIFRHVNENKHSTVAVIRGEDGKLYERGLKKVSKVKTISGVKPKQESDKKSIEKLPKKKAIGVGNNESVYYTSKSSKQSWNRGDSVTFESKTGSQKVGRVLKVDDILNMTTIRLANGLVETVNNKKIIV